MTTAYDFATEHGLPPVAFTRFLCQNDAPTDDYGRYVVHSSTPVSEIVELFGKLGGEGVDIPALMTPVVYVNAAGKKKPGFVTATAETVTPGTSLVAPDAHQVHITVFSPFSGTPDARHFVTYLPAVSEVAEGHAHCYPVTTA
jgi:hypothetical protein